MPRDLDVLVRPPTLKWRTYQPVTKWTVGRVRTGVSMSAQISALSTEYVLVQVSAREDGALVDPISLAARMAFVGEDDAPGVDDWNEADWDSDTSRTPAVYSVRCLVGPDDGVELVAGTYAVWVEITDDPETVVRRAGFLRVV